MFFATWWSAFAVWTQSKQAKCGLLQYTHKIGQDFTIFDKTDESLCERGKKHHMKILVLLRVKVG